MSAKARPYVLFAGARTDTAHLEQLMEIHRCYIASVRHWLGKKDSAGWSKRLRLLCWEDESYYKLGEGPRKCLSDLPVCRAQLAKATALRGRTKSGTIALVQKINMWMAFGGAGILAFWCTPDTGDDRTCLRFFTEPLPYDAIVGAGEKLFDILARLANTEGRPMLDMDRLGGGNGDAVKLHFNPLIKKAAIEANVGCAVLAPYGAFTSPAETAWDILKSRVSKMPPPGAPRFDEFGHQVLGPTTWAEFRGMIKVVVDDFNSNPALIRSCIYRRGLGEEFDRRWGATELYKSVEEKVKPYNLVKHSFRPQLIMREDKPAPTRARSASYARWWCGHCVDPRMVPQTRPPGPAGPCGADGYENTCRMCGTGKTKKHPEGTLLLCDGEGCTAAWHTKCLGLPAVPAGTWFCPCCKHAPGRAVMPRWPPAPKAAKAAAKKPAPVALESDVEEADESEDEFVRVGDGADEER
jgi:hypothetical protein